jgi:CBS domain-containing protein
MRVSEIMTGDVSVCRETDDLAGVARRMEQQDCGCLPVTSDGRRLVGIVSDRDICLLAGRTGKPLTELHVADAMSSPVRTCSADASLAEAEYVMREAQVRRLPVVDESGALVGILALADLAREAEHERKLRHPEVSRIEIGTTLAAISQPRA